MATLAERIAEIEAPASVLSATLVGDPKPVNETPPVHLARIATWRILGDVVLRDQLDLAIVNYDSGDGSGDAYFVNKVPRYILPESTVEYFSDRTASTVSAAQINAYCTAKWAEAVQGAAAIRQFRVAPIDGSTVEVAGVFDMGDGTWEQRVYFVHLVDPDGAVTTASENVKFERRV